MFLRKVMILALSLNFFLLPAADASFCSRLVSSLEKLNPFSTLSSLNKKLTKVFPVRVNSLIATRLERDERTLTTRRPSKLYYAGVSSAERSTVFYDSQTDNLLFGSQTKLMMVPLSNDDTRVWSLPIEFTQSVSLRALTADPAEIRRQGPSTSFEGGSQLQRIGSDIWYVSGSKVNVIRNFGQKDMKAEVFENPPGFEVAGSAMESESKWGYVLYKNGSLERVNFVTGRRDVVTQLATVGPMVLYNGFLYINGGSKILRYDTLRLNSQELVPPRAEQNETVMQGEMAIVDDTLILASNNGLCSFDIATGKGALTPLYAKFHGAVLARLARGKLQADGQIMNPLSVTAGPKETILVSVQNGRIFAFNPNELNR